MKSKTTPLLLKTTNIIELTDEEINGVLGASTYVCSNCISIKIV